MSRSPFDFTNAVSHEKVDIVRNSPNPEIEIKGYNAWITNKTLSYFEDSILYANEMNKYYDLPAQMQFDYFLNSINKRKRFRKQAKKVVSDDAQAVATFFKYSLRRAEEALNVLSADQVAAIKEKIKIGG